MKRNTKGGKFDGPQKNRGHLFIHQTEKLIKTILSSFVSGKKGEAEKRRGAWGRII